MGSMRMVTLVVVIYNKTVFKHHDVMKNSDSLSRSVTHKLSLLQRLILDSKNANENNKEWQSESFKNNSFETFFYLSIFFKKQSRIYSLFVQMLCSLILTMLWLIFLELEIYMDRNN